MVFDKSQILLLQRNVDKNLFYLTRKIEAIVDTEEKLDELNTQIRNYTSRYTFEAPDTNNLLQLEIIAGKCRKTEGNLRLQLREIDNIASIIASNVALMIDYCIEVSDTTLILWIRNKIKQLADLKEMGSNAPSDEFFFPTATALLASYIFKTRSTDKATRFTGIRNAIRLLLK